MSMRADHASIAHRPLWRRQQFWRVVLPAVAVAAAAVAGLLVYNSFVGTSGVGQIPAGTTYPEPPKPKTVPLDAAARSVARTFVQTAVARKNLAAAYAIAGPKVREGMTLKQWLTGNIAVVPYLVTSETVARLAIDESYKTSALLEVSIDTPHQRGRIFYIDLIKRHGKWLVDGWVPRATPAIPARQ